MSHTAQRPPKITNGVTFLWPGQDVRRGIWWRKQKKPERQYPGPVLHIYYHICIASLFKCCKYELLMRLSQRTPNSLKQKQNPARLSLKLVSIVYFYPVILNPPRLAVLSNKCKTQQKRSSKCEWIEKLKQPPIRAGRNYSGRGLVCCTACPLKRVI